MDIEFVERLEPDARLSALAIGVFEGEAAAPPPVHGADAAAHDLARWGFDGAAHTVRDVSLPGWDGADRVLLIGLGPRPALNDLDLEAAAAGALSHLRGSGIERLDVYVPEVGPEQAARLAFGLSLAAYSFDKYRTRPLPDAAPPRAARVLTSEPTAAAAAFAPLSRLAEAVDFARDLVSEPPNVLFPAAFAARLEALSPLGVDCEVLDEPALEALGMGALLGVGQGSPRASQVAVLKWMGGREGDPPIALVGKGVCFDSGGLSLKAKNGMEEMKWDMAGAAAVAGALRAAAALKLPLNVVGLLGLVENMPDGAAQRPSDVVVSLSGQTIEVVNTDAEGRLVLCDVLWYAQQTFSPRMIIDVATLTGAIQVALGADCAGLFSNDDDLAARLLAAGAREGEQLWRMPLIAAYEAHIKSHLADMKNLGEPFGEAISAALFLQRFVRDRPWAHIDMAASAWRKTSAKATSPDGATGFGVRLLTRLLLDAAGAAR